MFHSTRHKAGAAAAPASSLLAAVVGPGDEVSSSGSAMRRTSPPGQLWFPLLHPGENHVRLPGTANTDRTESVFYALGQREIDLL